MSRADKIRKLCNAIRMYRGATATAPDADKVKWVRTPQPSQLNKIEELLMALGLNTDERGIAIGEIDAFKYRSDFEEWIKEFQELKKDGTGL